MLTIARMLVVANTRNQRMSLCLCGQNTQPIFLRRKGVHRR